MVNTFVIKNIVDSEEITNMVQLFDFKQLSNTEIQSAIQKAFSDYIISALDELGSSEEERGKIYIEANFHLEKAKKLLEGMPHPAGKMSYRLNTMQNTLNKLVEGKDNFATERASRFMEKNLVRRLRDIWQVCTSQPFVAGNSSGYSNNGHSPRDFIIFCFQAASKHYPEITWFEEVNYKIADMMIKKVR